MDVKWRPGSVRISQYHGGERGSGVHITLMDEAARIQVIEIDLAVDEFGRVLLGGEGPCEYEIRPNQHLLGMKREHKTEVIFVPRLPWKWREDQKAVVLARKALAPYQVDGWQASIADLTNGHCNAHLAPQALVQLAMKAGLEAFTDEDPPDGTAQRVTFVRYVNPDTGEPVARDAAVLR